MRAANLDWGLMHDPEESIQMGEVEPLSFSDQTMNVELVQRLLRDREWTWAVLAARMDRVVDMAAVRSGDPS